MKIIKKGRMDLKWKGVSVTCARAASTEDLEGCGAVLHVTAEDLAREHGDIMEAVKPVVECPCCGHILRVAGVPYAVWSNAQHGFYW